MASVIATRETSYPIRPDSEVLRDLPTSETLGLNLAALDTDGAQIARACQEVSLSEDAPQNFSVEMFPQPPCSQMPRNLDLSLTVETSSRTWATNLVSLEDMLYPDLGRFVDDIMISGRVRFNIVVFGAGQPTQHLDYTEDRTTVKTALEALQDQRGGWDRPFEGIGVSANTLRRQAACGHRPALLWIGSGEDNSPRGTADQTILRLVGNRGQDDTTDDIFVFAIGLSNPGLNAMRILLDEDRVVRSDVTGALNRGRLNEALGSARVLFESLVEP